MVVCWGVLQNVTECQTHHFRLTDAHSLRWKEGEEGGKGGGEGGGREGAGGGGE